jgi:CDP-diacylglycerol--serine O-phosphatidyltransferase
MMRFQRRTPKVPGRPRRFGRAPAVNDPSAPHRRRGIYLLPNAFTTAALFCGFFAIVQAMNLRFSTAGVAIFVAMVLDSLDGRVARLTNTQTDFGAEYDSLSDMVAFGIAPALVVYQWSLLSLGQWGWFAAFIYVAGAALRLARFNTNIEVVDKNFFQGLPSPAAAAIVAGFVWVLDANGFIGNDLSWVSWVVTLYAGLSMVSNSPFYSFKGVNFKNRVPFLAAFLVVVLVVLFSTNPPVWFFALFTVYGLSGHLLWLWRFATRNKRSPIQ